MVNQEHQEWRNSWNSGDKEWAQLRLQDWKRISEQLRTPPFRFLTGSNVKRLKAFFLTSYPPDDKSFDHDQDINRPLAGIPGDILFECWFSPDHSDEHIQGVIRRYPDSFESSRLRFREMMRDFFPENGNLFGGLESRFYLMLGGNRCRKEIDYPDLDEATYLERCNTHFNECLPIIDRILFSEPDQVNTEDIALLMVPEYLDSYKGAFDFAVSQEKELDGFSIKAYGLDEIRRIQLERCREISDAEDKFHPMQVEIAKALLTSIGKMKLNAILVEVIAPCLTDRKK